MCSAAREVRQKAFPQQNQHDIKALVATRNDLPFHIVQIILIF